MPQPPDQPNLPSSATVLPLWRTPEWAERTMTGIENIRPEWRLTKPITPDLRKAAADWLAAHDRFTRPTSDGSIRDWLTALGLQVAGGAMSAEEATLRIGAYADTLAGRPGYWFTRATLRACAEKFKWFPAAAELIEALTEICGERDNQVALARKVVNQPDHPNPDRAMPRTMAQRIAELANIKRDLGMDPERPASGQIGDAFVSRRDEDRAAPLYVWFMPDGTTRMAADRPPGGRSKAEMDGAA